jgi:hypothetical protein
VHLFQILQDVLKNQGHFLRGPESSAIKTAVKAIHECAERFVSEQDNLKLVEIFQLTTPQGQEVLEWLSSWMLSRYAHVFARNQLDSLRKVAQLTTEEISKINTEYYSSLAGHADSQIGGRISVGA